MIVFVEFQEKVEKKPKKWGLTHCFKPSPYRKNHREKAKMEDQMKLVQKRESCVAELVIVPSSIFKT